MCDCERFRRNLHSLVVVLDLLVLLVIRNFESFCRVSGTGVARFALEILCEKTFAIGVVGLTRREVDRVVELN